MTLCPLHMRVAPDAWAIGFLVFGACATAYNTWFSIGSIRRRQVRLYQDSRLNPTGTKAIIHGVVLLVVPWVGYSLFLWAFACGCVYR